MNDYSTLYLLVVLSLLCCICPVLCNIMSLTIYLINREDLLDANSTAVIKVTVQ